MQNCLKCGPGLRSYTTWGVPERGEVRRVDVTSRERAEFGTASRRLELAWSLFNPSLTLKIVASGTAVGILNALAGLQRTAKLALILTLRGSISAAPDPQL